MAEMASSTKKIDPESPKGDAVSADETTTQRPAVRVPVSEGATESATAGDAVTDESLVFDVQDLSVYYGDFRAVRDVNMRIGRNEITAMIGPSGCGKSTVLRSFNRMNDLIPIARVEGTLNYRGVNLYDPRVDPVEVRRQQAQLEREDLRTGLSLL